MAIERMIKITETRVYTYDEDIVNDNIGQYSEAAQSLDIDVPKDDEGNPVVSLELAMQIDQKLVENGDTTPDELGEEGETTEVKFEIVEVDMTPTYQEIPNASA